MRASPNPSLKHAARTQSLCDQVLSESLTFEHLIYSCDYGSIKPELAIYRNCLELLKAAPQDILYLDDRAENVEAAARLGINSVLFDTVEKTASRVESRFDIPVPSYGRCGQSSSQYSSTNRRADRMRNPIDAAKQPPTGTRERVLSLSDPRTDHRNLGLEEVGQIGNGRSA